MRMRSQLRKNKSQRFSQAYKKVKLIGILYTIEDKAKHEHIKSLVKKLEFEGKVVKVLCLLPPKKENYEFLFDYFSKKDLNFWGKLESDDVKKFIEEPFDILYNPDMNPDFMLQYILASSKAKCRVGSADESRSTLFELMIKSNGSIKSLIDDMYKYSSQLK
ncbi:MAG TPA: hypothetical protein PKC24_11600 [Cyclobacteriaceae bacterium]|mgnify:CR=1 FL=1|nr:hypothetical protein [Cyclobacteriaceae bacterium]